MKIPAPSIRTKNYYLITSANKTVIGKKTLEFFHEKLISFELIDQTKDDLVYQYTMLNQCMQGSSLLHYWSADMEALQSGIILIADLSGELTDVYNFKSLNRKFTAETITQVNAKYPKDFCATMIEATAALLGNKDQYLQSLIGYSSWRFFFQNFYRNYSPSEVHSYTINKHFGTIDLPLIINQESTGYEYGKNIQHISNKAVLDVEHFKKAAFTRMLKDITGIYNIDATLNIEMEENYSFSKNGYLVEGEMFLKTAVYDWYTVTTAHQLKQLSLAEAEALNDEMKNSEMAL